MMLKEMTEEQQELEQLAGLLLEII